MYTSVYLRNFGTEVTYNDLDETQPLQTGLSLVFLPLGFVQNRAGISMRVALGAEKKRDAPYRAAAGLEFSPVSPVNFRAGYEYGYGRDLSPGGLSGGLSIDIGKYGIDGGYAYRSEIFGGVWALTVRYKSDEMNLYTAMDYYKVAERFFRKEKYNASIAYAKKAIRLDPNHWQAHSLIARAISAKQKESGLSVALIYTGNNGGAFLPFDVHGVSMGGLARQAAVIARLKKENPVAVTIAAGNMIERLSPPLKAQLSGRYYAEAGFDAVGLGTGEIEFGTMRYCESAGKFTPGLICTNCSKKSGNCFTDVKIIEAGDHSFAIFNVVPGSYSSRKDKDTTLFARTMEIVRLTQSPRVSMCNCKILIVHDSWEVVRHYASSVPLLDVIVAGNLPQQFETPMKINGKPVVSTGAQGKYTGILTLVFGKDRKLASYSNRLVPLTDEIIPDPVMEAMIDRSVVQADIEENGLTFETLKMAKTDGVFTFLSDRRGTAHVYLKVMKNKTEFPLTFGEASCSMPEISFKNGLITYLTRNETLKRQVCMAMRINGSELRELDWGGSVAEARFSTDEQWMYAAVATGRDVQTDIYRMRPSGGEPEPVIAWKDGFEQDMSFSYDNTNMVFTSTRDGRRQVYITDMSGNTPVRMTDDPSHNYQPRFSPLDDYIAYLSEKNNFNGKMDIWVYDRKAGKTARSTLNADVRQYAWLDDKGTILYSAGVNLADLNTINIVSGSNTKLIVADSSKEYSETNPVVIFYGGRKRILYTREYDNGARKLYMVNTDGTEDRQIGIDRGNCWME
jgi:hypothetical protein